MRILSQHHPGALEQGSSQECPGHSSSKLQGAALLCLGFAPLPCLKAAMDLLHFLQLSSAQQVSLVPAFLCAVIKVWGSAL